MKIVGIIAIVLVAGILVVVVMLSRYGVFERVEVSERIVGPYLLVYKQHIGDYKNVGPVMDELYYDLKDNYAIETTKGFGLYYDNPREVSKENLRSIVGCIVEGKTTDELERVRDNYNIREYPASNSVVAEFPYQGKMSIMMGVFKVYPKLNWYISENNYSSVPIMELYDQPNEKIRYIASIELAGSDFDAFLK